MTQDARLMSGFLLLVSRKGHPVYAPKVKEPYIPSPKEAINNLTRPSKVEGPWLLNFKPSTIREDEALVPTGNRLSPAAG